jgi:hypothetical protein
MDYDLGRLVTVRLFRSRVIDREKKTVRAMVFLYCSGRHGTTRGVLCESCAGLLDYSSGRLDRCPYGDEKPTCKECTIHCYKPDRREAMRQVMRYSGPRMLWRHPLLSIVHLWQERTRKSPGKPGRRPSEAKS